MKKEIREKIIDILNSKEDNLTKTDLIIDILDELEQAVREERRTFWSMLNTGIEMDGHDYVEQENGDLI